MMKQTKFFKMFRLLFLVYVLAIVLCGCAGGEQGDTTGVTTTASDPQKGPQKGGSVVVGIQQDLDSLDPHMADAAGTSEVLFNIFEEIGRAHV